MSIDKGKKLILIHGCLKPACFDLLKSKKIKQVVIMEGRPTLETGRKNAAQLLKHGIQPIVISDNMAGSLFFQKKIKEVWLGSQENSREGAVCETGSLVLAVLAKEHGVNVRCFPSDEKLKALAKEKDLFHFMGRRIAPKGIKGYVPLLELVPTKYIKES